MIDAATLVINGMPKMLNPCISIYKRAAPFATENVVGASVKVGTGPNHVALPPRSYTAKDLKVTANDGKSMGYTDRVRVSGTMYYPIVSSVEFKCGLSNTLIESARTASK